MEHSLGSANEELVGRCWETLPTSEPEGADGDVVLGWEGNQVRTSHEAM